MVKGKIPSWLKTGLIFAGIAFLIELITFDLSVLIATTNKLLFSSFTYLETIIQLPLRIIGEISNELVLTFVDHYWPPSITPNTLGFLLIIVFWLGVGALVDHLYRRSKK